MRIWCLHRCADKREIPGCEHGSEGNRERAVAVVDQEACREHSLLDLPAELTGGCRPRARGAAAGQPARWTQRLPRSMSTKSSSVVSHSLSTVQESQARISSW